MHVPPPPQVNPPRQRRRADDGPSTSGAPPAADAWALLKAFTAADARGGAAAAQRFLSGSAERDGLRSALMVRGGGGGPGHQRRWHSVFVARSEAVWPSLRPPLTARQLARARRQARAPPLRPLPAAPRQAVYSQPWPDAGWAPQPSDPDVLIGVVAGDARLAVRALRDWCGALGLPYIQPESKVSVRVG